MPRAPTIVDPNLAKYATDVELKTLQAINRLGSHRKAALEFGVQINAVNDAVKRLKERAARRGYSPEHHMTSPVPDGFHAKRISTNFDANGVVKQQWVIGEPDKERQLELMQRAVATLADPIRGLSPAIAAPRRVSKELLSVFPIGDPHFGMLAWAKECGEEFNLETARRLTLGAVDRLMASAPETETCVIILLGDVFHMNDQTNATPGHKHQLDASNRFADVVEVAIEAYRHVILRALQKYRKVVFRVVGGNHDPQAHLPLAYTLKAYFHNQKRVVVDTSPSPFWYFKFGKVLMGTTHGDKAGHAALPGVMAADRAVDWGSTVHRYWYTGHVHSQHVREFPGVLCESFRTLASKDHYATANGYRAGRDMVCIVHHQDHGEVERHRCDVGWLT